MNCTTNNYNIQDKEDSEAISSDGEFQEFKDLVVVGENHELLIQPKYQNLVKDKYKACSQSIIDEVISGPKFDNELWKKAEQEIQDKQNKFFNKHQITRGTRQVVPRWASDDSLIQLIEEQQKKINPEAIFGVIDPRDSNNVSLKDMFKVTTINQMRLLNRERGSSARQWNDHSEFATPAMIMKEQNQNFKINNQNINQITSFNPYDI